MSVEFSDVAPDGLPQRAGEYFGYSLPEPDPTWLAGQPDAGTDPLVLCPFVLGITCARGASALPLQHWMIRLPTC
jgi:hypothetical protein